MYTIFVYTVIRMWSLSSIRLFTMFYPTIQRHTPQRENKRRASLPLMDWDEYCDNFSGSIINISYSLWYVFHLLNFAHILQNNLQRACKYLLNLIDNMSRQECVPRYENENRQFVYSIYLQTPNKIIYCGVVWCLLGPRRARAVRWWWWASHSVMRHSGYAACIAYVSFSAAAAAALGSNIRSHSLPSLFVSYVLSSACTVWLCSPVNLFSGARNL